MQSHTINRMNELGTQGKPFVFIIDFDFEKPLILEGETSETLRIIYYPFVYAVALCCLLLAFVLLIDFLKLIAPQKGAR